MAGGGKKGRKLGKGSHKMSKSKWGNYAGLMNHLASRRLETMGRRFCKHCSTQFHSRSVLNKHIKKEHP